MAKKIIILRNLLVVLCLALVSCQDSDKDNDAFTPETNEDVYIRIWTTNYPSPNCYSDLIIENRETDFSLQCTDGIEENKTDLLTEEEWSDLLRTMDFDALATISMEPRCGNQLEYIEVRYEDLEIGFGYEVESSAESIKAQLEGETDRVIDFILELQEIRAQYLE